MKANSRTIKVFGRALPVTAIALIAMVGAATALLSVYVTTTGTANVNQSVVLTDCQMTGGSDTCSLISQDSASFTANVFGGDTRYVGLNITNRASVGANFNLTSTPVADATVTFSDNYPTCSNVVSNPVTLTAGSAKFYCVNITWNIAANSTSGEAVTLSVVPA